MSMKKLCRALLFPHIAVLLLLVPAAACALIFAMLRLPESSPLRFAAYMLAFYALVTVCARMPRVFFRLRAFRRNDRRIRRWLDDVHLRVRVTLAGNVIWNSAYGGLQLGLGIFHGSAWFYSLAGYYFSLAAMRGFLMRYALRHSPGEKRAPELRLYRACGWIFLLTNLALSAMLFYMLREDRMLSHHEITTIAMAAYTFTSLTMAIVNVFRYRRYNSPLLSASKAISLASACVSLLTLEGTMLATFQNGGLSSRSQQLLMALSGAGVSIFIVTMAIYMILKANRLIKNTEENHE